MLQTDLPQTPADPGQPLLLAGPILRRTEATEVTVWVALRRPCRVQLTVYDTQAGAQIQAARLVGEANTYAIGQNLHLIALTAEPIADWQLVSDRIYAYDLQFSLDAGTQLSLAAALGSQAPEAISYFGHGLPTFALPPRDWQNLRLIHGSCRKPHAHGHDALPIIDPLIAAVAADPRRRPHQLFFTGDQIYSDDVSEPFLWWVNRLGSDLLGWQEELPGGYYARDLKPGERADIATDRGGFTAGMGSKVDKINSHLLSLGEFLATYLLYFSAACWPQSFPSRQDVDGPKDWNHQVERLQQFIRTLPYTRRALANVPVYTIFDDHDVSDDWNLNQAWCLRVLGRPLGRRVVQNALLAYALMQGWGNTPDQFLPDRPGGKLLGAIARWSAAGGTDPDAWSLITRYLGLPETDPLTSLPKFRRDNGYWVLDSQPDALAWHYSVESECHRILALDSRTQRGFPTDKSALAPPQLLSQSALRRQLDQFLQDDPPQKMTFVIAPTNPFSLKVLDWIQRYHLRHNKVFSTDVGDAWNLPTGALANFLVSLFRQRQRVVVLSGDIHFSFAVRLTMESYDPAVNSGVLVQFTSSAIANEEPLTRILHTVLKHWLLPEKPRRWLGKTQPADLQEVSGPTRSTVDFQPDWQATLQWLRRQNAEAPEFDDHAAWLPAPNWLHWLKFWKAHWWQSGREVVGLNNISLVQFQSHMVQQDSYWYAPWAPDTIVRSRFEGDLSAQDSPTQQSVHDPQASDQPISLR